MCAEPPPAAVRLAPRRVRRATQSDAGGPTERVAHVGPAWAAAGPRLARALRRAGVRARWPTNRTIRRVLARSRYRGAALRMWRIRASAGRRHSETLAPRAHTLRSAPVAHGGSVPDRAAVAPPAPRPPARSN